MGARQRDTCRLMESPALGHPATLSSIDPNGLSEPRHRWSGACCWPGGDPGTAYRVSGVALIGAIVGGEGMFTAPRNNVGSTSDYDIAGCGLVVRRPVPPATWPAGLPAEPDAGSGRRRGGPAAPVPDPARLPTSDRAALERI